MLDISSKVKDRLFYFVSLINKYNTKPASSSSERISHTWDITHFLWSPKQERESKQAQVVVQGALLLESYDQ